MKCHLYHDLHMKIQVFLMVDTQGVFNALNGFSYWSSLRIFGRWAQTLLDATCGYAASTTQDCSQALTILINILLSAKANPWLSLALVSCGSLNWAEKERIRCMSHCHWGRFPSLSQQHLLLCCTFPPCWLFGQVRVGVKDSFTCHLLLPPAADANDIHNLLKLDINNAFNECNQFVFLNRVTVCLPEIFGWIHWYYVFPTKLWFG